MIQKNKKRIFWLVNDFQGTSGTVVVTKSIIEGLKDDFDITIISLKNTAKPSDLSNDINFVTLEVEDKFLSFFETLKSYIKHFRLIKSTSLIFSFLFKYRKKYRQKLFNLTTNEDLIIASSIKNYLIVPKKRLSYMHWNYNFDYFNNFKNKFFRLFCVKFDKYIFLTKTSLNKFKKKHKRTDACYVYNPVRFEPKLYKKINNNNIAFIGRFMDQKNPLLFIETINELKKLNCSFHAIMYGFGYLEKEIIEKINEYKLTDVLKIQPPSNNIEKELENIDIVCMTSKMEGLPLVLLEANSQSVPFVSTKWGDDLEELIDVEKCNGFITNYDPKVIAKTLYKLISNSSLLLSSKESAYFFSLNFQRNKICDIWKKEILFK